MSVDKVRVLLSKHLEYDSQSDTYYFIDYHPYWHGNNPEFNKEDGLLLDFKKGYESGISHFYNKISRVMNTLHDADANIWLCPVPSHSPQNTDSSVYLLMRRFTKIKSAQLLRRTKEIAKLSTGGDRAVSVHTNSISTDTSIPIGKNAIIILLDDILTTGNSIKACRSILIKRQDVKSVISIVLAKTKRTCNHDSIVTHDVSSALQQLESISKPVQLDSQESKEYKGKALIGTSRAETAPKTIPTCPESSPSVDLSDIVMETPVSVIKQSPLQQSAITDNAKNFISVDQKSTDKTETSRVENKDSACLDLDKKRQIKREQRHNLEKKCQEVQLSRFGHWLSLILTSILCGVIAYLLYNNLNYEYSQTGIVVVAVLVILSVLMFLFSVLAVITRICAFICLMFRWFKLCLFWKRTSLSCLNLVLYVFYISIVALLFIASINRLLFPDY